MIDSPPDWIEKAVSYLGMVPNALKLQQPWIKIEFVDRHICYEEFIGQVEPDTDVLNDEIAQGYLFSLY